MWNNSSFVSLHVKQFAEVFFSKSLTESFKESLVYLKKSLNVRHLLNADSKGNPRCLTNSKGKKRRVASKDLQQAIKTSDANFLDFVRRCLE